MIQEYTTKQRSLSSVGESPPWSVPPSLVLLWFDEMGGSRTGLVMTGSKHI